MQPSSMSRLKSWTAAAICLLSTSVHAASYKRAQIDCTISGTIEDMDTPPRALPYTTGISFFVTYDEDSGTTYNVIGSCGSEHDCYYQALSVRATALGGGETSELPSLYGVLPASGSYFENLAIRVTNMRFIGVVTIPGNDLPMIYFALPIAGRYSTFEKFFADMFSYMGASDDELALLTSAPERYTIARLWKQTAHPDHSDSQAALGDLRDIYVITEGGDPRSLFLLFNTDLDTAIQLHFPPDIARGKSYHIKHSCSIVSFN